MKYKKMFTALILAFSMLLSGCSLSEVADSAKSSIKDTVSSFVVGDAEDVPSISEDKYAYSVLDENTKKVYDQVLDGSALIMEDGTQIKLSPSESTPYENGVVTLYSHLGSTIDLRKVDAISITGQEVSISNPFQSTEEPSS